MPPTVTGTASQVNASAGDGSTSVTVPGDCDLVVVFWAFWDGPTNTGMAGLTLDGDPFTIIENEIDVGDLSATGIAILENPSVGSQTFAWDWTDNTSKSEGGWIALVYVTDATIGDAVRDSGTDHQSGGAACDVSVLTATDDLVLAAAQSFSSNPDITGGTELLDNISLNGQVYDVSEVPEVNGALLVEMTGEAYSSMAVIALTGGGSPPEPPTVEGPFYDALIALAPEIYLPLWEESGFPSDYSGNDNHVTVVSGNPTYHITGPLANGGFAMDFDGTDDGLTVPDNATLDWGDVFSIGCFFRRASASDTNIDSLVNCGSNAGQIAIDGNNDRITFAKHNVSIICETSAGVVNDTDWHFVVCTKNGTSDVHIYLDGIDVTGSVNSVVCNDPTEPFCVARAPSGPETFPGDVCEVFGMGYELSQAEVEALYDAAQEIDMTEKQSFYMARRRSWR
jgi:Concanavalin A-like lectin/glucanases superfamily